MMKLKELLAVIPSFDKIFIYDWDTNMPLYCGANLEGIGVEGFSLKKLHDQTVLIIHVGAGADWAINIGIKTKED